MSDPDPESIRAAMDEAWRDHHHARDQTWRALQIEFLIAAAVVGVNWQIDSLFAAVVSGWLVFLTALCGVQITLHHRNRVEITKFRHIMHCEEVLGLHRDDLINGVTMPEKISFWHVFCPWKGNTALFILRMHVAILVFSILFLAWGVTHTKTAEPRPNQSVQAHRCTSLTISDSGLRRTARHHLHQRGPGKRFQTRRSHQQELLRLQATIELCRARPVTVRELAWARPQP